MENNKKKHVLITGAGSGLGAALTKKYIEKGYHVTLTGRTKEKLETVASTFKDSDYSIYALDVSSIKDVIDVFKTVESEVQPIDILVNNAGVGHFSLMEELTEDEIEQMIDTNLKGTIYCTQQVIKKMKNNNAGSIINIISTAGVEGKVNESVYCASKFGVRGFTESIIKELENTKVQVNAIYMGGMNTPFWDDIIEEKNMGHMMEPYDIADLVIANTELRKNISVSQVIIKNH